MNIGNPQPPQLKMNIDAKNHIVHIDEDVFNVISGIQLATASLSSPSVPKETINLSIILKPLLTCQEYFTKKGPNRGYPKRNVKDYNPHVVVAFDDLVRQFNIERERIIQDKDLQALIEYENKFRAVVYGK